MWIKKASNLINKEGVPGPYVSILIQLEDCLKQTLADKEVQCRHPIRQFPAAQISAVIAAALQSNCIDRS